MKLSNHAIILLMCGYVVVLNCAILFSCSWLVAQHDYGDPRQASSNSGLDDTFNGPVTAAPADALKPSIALLGHRVEKVGENTYVRADLALVNSLSVPVAYYGYLHGPSSEKICPLHSCWLKHGEDDWWQHGYATWCATGTGRMVVRPGESGRFRVSIRVPFAAAQVRLHCTWPADDGLLGSELQSPAIPGPEL